MNITCPRTNRICWDCTAPCQALEINPVVTVVPEPEKPFLGILAPLVETLGFEQTQEGINKITVTAKL